MAKVADKEQVEGLEGTLQVTGAILEGTLQSCENIRSPYYTQSIAPIDTAEELVKLTIPIDYSRPFDTQISIQVNGQTVIVQRGVEVTIKRKFAEAYNNAEAQRGRAVAMMYSLSNDN